MNTSLSLEHRRTVEDTVAAAPAQVLEPADLRGKVKRALHEAAGRYV